MARKQILLTNDDGIQSPGLWAAAEALSSLGFVTIAAPREQYSGAGRSQPLSSDGRIHATRLQIGNQEWETYAVGGSPAQCVLYGVLELLDGKLPDLVVSGINYGENVGNAVTVSGTIGAAIEAATMGIPALGVSLQLPYEVIVSPELSTAVDFSTASYFTAKFAERMLAGRLPEDVDVLKLEVPLKADRSTPWRLTKLSRHRYYVPLNVQRPGALDEPGSINWMVKVEPGEVDPDSDVHALVFEGVVAVTPLSLDMTSRVDLTKLDGILRGGPSASAADNQQE